jgi:hypothetical protein
MTHVQKLNKLRVDTSNFIITFVFLKLKIHWINFNRYFFTTKMMTHGTSWNVH